MKKVLILLFLISTSISLSQTDVSGAISSDTTWGTSGSPYTVTGNVLISSGVTLTIEAGVTIKVSSSAIIQNNGTLIAIGTSSDKIIFTSNESTPSAGDWKYIFFSNTSVDPTYDGSGNYSAGSTLQYVDVLYGGSDTSKGALQITDSSVYLKNISVKNSSSYGLNFSKSSGGSVGVSKIISSEISNNSATGIYCNCYQYNKSITVETSTINNNTGYGISTGGGDAGGSHVFNYKNNIITNNGNSGILANANGTQNISGNLIYNNTGYGIRSRGNGTYTIEKNIIVGNSSVGVHGIYATHVIDNNVIANNVGGIEISQGGNYTVSDNQIVFNNNLGDGSGFDPYGGSSQKAWSSPVSLTRNTFYSNTSTSSTILSFQPDNGDPSFVINNNNIHKNISTYEFKNYRNSSSSNVDAENNYWGTLTESEIQTKIFDWSDDGSYGIVDYTPFSTALNTTAPISPPSNVTKSVSGSDVVLNWSANGESDIAGYKLYYGTPTGYSYVTIVDIGNVTTYTVTGGDIATEYAITAYDSDKDDDGDDMVDGNESWFSISKEVKVTLSSSASSISEPTNSSTLTATLDNTSSADVVVNLTYTGTATNATDYSGAASITISAGSLTGTTAITAIDDTDVELTETIIIDMGDVSGGAENGTQQVTINLTDNDLPSISSITVDKTSIDENGGVAIVTATIDAVQSKEATIPLTVTGTSTIDTDYSTAFASKTGTTVAGGNGAGSGLNQFNGNRGIDVDSSGNIYISEYYNNRIMKWEPGATSGTVVAGGNGQGSANNQFARPIAVDVDSSGNIYISDSNNARIMKWDLGAVSGTVVAGGNGGGSGLNQFSTNFSGIDVDSSGNIYVADQSNSRIMKWTPEATTGILVAGGNGNGSANNQLLYPNDVVVDSSGNIYIADRGNNRIMKWAQGATEGVLVAGGNGQSTNLNATFGPYGVDLDSFGNVYVAEFNNSRITKWAPGATSGIAVAGLEGEGSGPNQLKWPVGVIVNSLGDLYVSDLSNQRVQKIQISPEITIAAGATTGTITFTGIQDSTYELDETIIVTPSTSPTNATSSISTASTITITDDDDPPTVSFALSSENISEGSATDVTLTATLSFTSPKITTIPYTMSGTATITDEYTITDSPITIAAGATTGTVTISTNGLDDTDVEVTETIILTFGTLTNASTSTTDVTLNLTDNDLPSVSSIAVDKTSIDENGGVAVITATISDVQSKDVIIPLTITGTSTIDTDYSTAFASKGYSTVAGGNGYGSALNQISAPYGIYVDNDENIYVSDSGNRVVKWAPGATEGVVVAGGNGSGSALNQLSGTDKIHVDESKNIYIVDRGNTRVVKWAPGASEGVLVAGGNGSGSALNQFNYPTGIHVDSDSNIYISDNGNNRVMKWVSGGSEGTVVAGGNDGGSAKNQLSWNQGIDLDSEGNIYIADCYNHRVMKWAPGASEGVLVAGGDQSGNDNQGSALNELDYPFDVNLDNSGNIFIADKENHRIMKWATGATEGVVVAGGNGSGSDANRIPQVISVFVDSKSNIYAGDGSNNRVQIKRNYPQVTIPSGSNTGTLTITAIQDALYEDDETIIVTPSTSPTNATSTISDALTVTIVDENFAPVATTQSDLAAKEQTEVTITLAGTDSNDDTLTYIIATLPTNGTLSDNGTVITADDLPKTLSSADVAYVSTSDIATSDGFTFKVNDGTVDSEAATISLVITAVNDAPVATAQTDVAATEQTAVTLTLAGTDLDNDTLSYVIQTLPTNGTLSDDGTVITADDLPKTTTSADVVYVSTSDTATSDSFTFKVNDGTVDSEAATVSLALTAVNDAPVATAQTDVAATEQTEVTISLAGTDAESDAITYIVSTLPTNGTLSDDGTVITSDDLPKTTTSTDVVYVSTSDTATSDSFTFKVNDGTVDSEAATVSLAITAVNDEPTKVNLSSLTIDENAAATEIGTLSTEDLDTNDTFTYELVSGEGDTDNSLFTIDSNKLKNTDAFDFETKSSYSVRVKSTDSGSALIEGVFTITVNNINDITVTSEITSTYCDGSDGTGAVTIVTSETNGEVSYSWTGPDSFTSTDQNLTGLESGTYNVTVKDDSFEKSIELVVEKTEIFNNLSVCYVTSDSEDFTKNRIFLSYQDIYNDKKYEILREGSSAGVYEKIGELDSGETSFLDTSSNSSSSSYSYRVRLLDNCDVVSPESSIHKTILLQSGLATDNSVNLSWTSYEGVSYSTYKIYRRVNNGSFEELTAISSTNNSYNDTAADVTQNAYSYYVSIAVESCTTTLKTGAKENLSNNFRYTSRANETTEIKSNQKFIQDDNGDYDDDGVLNSEDQCPDSPEGSTVDVNGCPVFTLPLDNNKVSVTSASCIGTTDGSIGLSIEDASYNYTVSISGQDDPVVLGGETKTASVTGLGTGTYTVCFKVDGQDTYEQCFEVNIAEPKALSVFIDVDNDNRTTSIQLSGSSSYNVEVNGQRYDVKGDRFTTNLPTGLSIIKISTDLDCQGVIEREVFISEDIHYYPNPTQTDVNVHVSGEDTMVQVSVFSEKGDLIYTKQQQIQDFSRKTNIDLSRQITGTYIVVMEGKTVRKTFKIVKR